MAEMSNRQAYAIIRALGEMTEFSLVKVNEYVAGQGMTYTPLEFFDKFTTGSTNRSISAQVVSTPAYTFYSVQDVLSQADEMWADYRADSAGDELVCVTCHGEYTSSEGGPTECGLCISLRKRSSR